MFSKLALFAIVSVPAFVAAIPGDIDDSCNTGDIHCCESTQDLNSPEGQGARQVASDLGILGKLLSLVDGNNVGVNCASVAGGEQCQQQPVCCSDNSFNGLLVFGCSPINLNI